jgi:hypothetical protein
MVGVHCSVGVMKKWSCRILGGVITAIGLSGSLAIQTSQTQWYLLGHLLPLNLKVLNLSYLTGWARGVTRIARLSWLFIYFRVPLRQGIFVGLLLKHDG